MRGKLRATEPERLLEHISLLVETYDTKRFFIVDDLFSQQRDETIRLCRMLADYQFRLKNLTTKPQNKHVKKDFRKLRNVSNKQILD